VRLSATEVDLVRDRFDLALRFVMGRLPPSALVARRVGTAVIQYFASPTYISRRGAPRELADLHDHDWVTFAHARELAPGPVPDLAHRPPRARTVCDDKFFARELLRSGAGIGVLPLYLAAADLRAGSLVRVLPRIERRHAAIYLVQPSRTKVPARVTAFREVLIEHLRQEPLGPPAPPS
jgi:DNA-binding transcriptional LysR family regulator